RPSTDQTFTVLPPPVGDPIRGAHSIIQSDKRFPRSLRRRNSDKRKFDPAARLEGRLRILSGYI
ncbi:MAG: hypothetical protein OXE81_02130, partial [Gammaproteobacteria bacterium]|nr:hypothetical protein [Gammaproteobacteria bacterium]